MHRDRHDRLTMLLTGCGLVYAVLVVAVSLAWFDLGDLDVESDFFAELGPAARHLAAGDLTVDHHPYKGPGHPALLAMLHTALGPLGVGWYRCAVLLSLAGVMLALGAVFHLASGLAGNRVAWGATLLTATCPLVFTAAHKAGSDGLFLGLATTTLAVALSPARHRWLIAGAVAGGAFLTRYAGAILPVWLLILAAREPADGTARRRLTVMCLVMAGFLIVTGPWFVLNIIETGSVLATRSAENVAREFAGAKNGLAAVSHGLLNLLRRPVQFSRMVLGWPVAMVACLGIGIALSNRPRGKATAVLLYAAAHLIVLAVVFFLPRFTLPLVPVAALFAARALLGDPLPGPFFRPTTWFSGRGHRLGWLLLAMAVASTIPRSVHAVRFHAAQQPVHLRAAIAFLRDQAPAVLMSRKAHAAFHAELEWRPYPVTRMPAGEFVRRAVDRGVDLVLAGPVERDYADTAFDLNGLERLRGVSRLYADSVNTVYRLDHELPDSVLGRDPEIARLRAQLEAAGTGERTARALELGCELAGALRRDGELSAAQFVLQDLVDATASAAGGAEPGPALLKARLDLAWTCLLTEDHAAGVAAIAPELDRFRTQPDRLLEARAHEYLAIHLATRGRIESAHQLLGSAASLYEAQNRPADRQRVIRLRRSLPNRR